MVWFSGLTQTCYLPWSWIIRERFARSYEGNGPYLQRVTPLCPCKRILIYFHLTKLWPNKRTNKNNDEGHKCVLDPPSCIFRTILPGIFTTWFSREMAYEERGQKFNTDDASLPSWLVENLFQPIRSAHTQIWVLEFLAPAHFSDVTSAVTSGGVAKGLAVFSGWSVMNNFRLSVSPMFWRHLLYFLHIWYLQMGSHKKRASSFREKSAGAKNKLIFLENAVA